IPGGTRLVQSSVAAELAVSTRSVREALTELAAEGFVRFDRRGGGGGGGTWPPRAGGHYRDPPNLRTGPAAPAPAAAPPPGPSARAARSATSAGLRPAIQLLVAMEAETDATRWAEHNARFHNVIDLAGNSPRLVAILKNLRELSTLYITHSVLAVPDRARRAN